MGLILYGLATVGVLRVVWVCFGGCLPALTVSSACPASIDPVLGAFVVAELSLAVVFYGCAARAEAHMVAVWAALASLCGRAVVDFYGALTFPPSVAMAHLIDLVLMLALLSGWLRAIPDTVRAARLRGGNHGHSKAGRPL
ncbi:MAG: hypothetical protein N3C12_13715 [Candidatus Binatia bacterium]|nr:hypothetical protein [Candidatus Binatia bacterium]